MNETVSYIVSHLASVVPETIEALKRDPNVQIAAIDARTERSRIRERTDMARIEAGDKKRKAEFNAALMDAMYAVREACREKGDVSYDSLKEMWNTLKVK